MKKTLVFSWMVVIAMCAMAQSNPIKIFGIGNSFTEDAMLQELMPICASANFPVTLAYPYKGGSTFADHVQRYQDKTYIYNYKKWEWGKTTMTTTGASSYTINAALSEDTWDIITFQQAAKSQYYPYASQTEKLPEILEIVKQNVPTMTKKAYYMYWADQNGGTYVLPTGQQATWDTIKTTCKRVMEEYGFDMLIPVGTAVQNARSSYLGDNLNRDKHHLSYTHGRYIAALTWYEVLSGKSCVGITYHPAEISDWAALVCQTAVHQAVLNPYELYDMSIEYGKDQGGANMVVFDLTDKNNQSLAQSTGYVSCGYTLTARTTAKTVIGDNGQNIAPYTTANTDYIKIANIPTEKTKFQWTMRDASTGERTWYISYLLVDAGTDISTIDMVTMAIPYDTITKESGACQIRSMKTVSLDLTGKDTLQDLYFIQSTTSTNMLTFRTFYLTIDAPKPKDTNANLSFFSISDLNTEMVENPIGYADVKEAQFPVHITLSSKLAKATVYQDGQEIEVSNEPDIYYLSTPQFADTTNVRIEVVAEDSAYTKVYTAKVVGANFVVSNWDLMLLGNLSLQNSILAGEPYESNGITLIARQASSDLFNFGGADKPGLYIRNAKESYGSCGLFIKAPKGVKGHMQIQIRPGATDKNYIYYAFAQNSGIAAPAQLYDKVSQSICLGNVLNGLKSLNYLTDGKWIDYSNYETAQDIYIYHTAGGMRYQRVVFTMINTEETPTDIHTPKSCGLCAEKLIVNGQMLIRYNGVLYSAQGSVVK